MTKDTMDQKPQYFWHKKALLSFIAVFFVVVIHNSTINQYQITPDFFTNLTVFIHNLFAYGIGAVAVPLFFFLSGLTIFRDYTLKEYPQKLKRRIKTLLIPYLLWNILGLLFSVLYTYTPLSSVIQGRELFTPTLENIFSGIFLFKYNYQFWFLHNLIIFTLLTPLFYFMISKKYLGAIFGALILCLPMLGNFFLHINLNFVIFYYLGCYIGKHYFNSFKSRAKPKPILVAIILSLILLIVRMLTVYQLFTLPVIISQLLLILLLFSLWVSSDIFIPTIKTQKYQNEFFPIYTIHTYFIAVIIKIIYLLFPKTSWMLLVNEISSAILTFYLTTVIAYSWHQKLPNSYKIFFGH